MKLPKKFTRRFIMTVCGVMLSGPSIALLTTAQFGVDPFQCFAMGTHGFLLGSTMSYGTYYMILSGLMLVVDWFLDKHYIGIATLINMFLLGYEIDFCKQLMGSWLPDPGMGTRIICLIAGLLIACLGGSLYMTSDLGVSVYDAMPIIFSNRTGRPFKYCRIGSDLICVIIGVICVVIGQLAGLMPGIGTVITAFFMGPVIDFFNRKISQPLLQAGSEKTYNSCDV